MLKIFNEVHWLNSTCVLEPSVKLHQPAKSLFSLSNCQWRSTQKHLSIQTLNCIQQINKVWFQYLWLLLLYIKGSCVNDERFHRWMLSSNPQNFLWAIRHHVIGKTEYFGVFLAAKVFYLVHSSVTTISVWGPVVGSFCSLLLYDLVSYVSLLGDELILGSQGLFKVD